MSNLLKIFPRAVAPALLAVVAGNWLFWWLLVQLPYPVI